MKNSILFDGLDQLSKLCGFSEGEQAGFYALTLLNACNHVVDDKFVVSEEALLKIHDIAALALAEGSVALGYELDGIEPDRLTDDES